MTGGFDADDWNVAGRPAHPDYFVISDLLLQGDAAADDGAGKEFIDRAILATGDHIRGTRDVDVPLLVETTADLEPAHAAAAAWATGFGAGMRIVRGVPTVVLIVTGATSMEMGLLDADQASVTWAAKQRGMRVAALFSDRSREDVLAAAWTDGAIVGCMFEARRDKLSRPGATE